MKSISLASSRWTQAVGLLLVLGSDFVLRDAMLPQQPSDFDIGLTLTIEWFILLFLLAFWIPRVEGRDLSNIGLGTFRLRYLWLSIATYFLLFLAWIGSYYALSAFGLSGLGSLQPELRRHSFPVLFVLLLTGTFLEEIFYRGYIIERTVSLTGRRSLGGFVSWVTFTLVHLKFFGFVPTLDVGILSAGLVILYLKEQSLWPCVLLHGINDAFGLLIGPLLIIP
jgi:membrane protease YdiL (CAAX protease family)